VFEEKLQLLNHNQLCSLSNAFISTYRRWLSNTLFIW
jgi:hypothetical protein